jgi:hypothetical protein
MVLLFNVIRYENYLLGTGLSIPERIILGGGKRVVSYILFSAKTLSAGVYCRFYQWRCCRVSRR